MLCDETFWQPAVDLLTDAADIQIATIGTTASVEAMAERVIAAMPDRFGVAGHSLGGRVALEVVRRVPNRVGLLGLFGTAYRRRAAGKAGEAEIAARQAMIEQASAQGMRELGTRWASRMLHPDRSKDLEAVERIVSMVERQGIDALRAQVAMGLSRPDFADLLPRITCRTLLLAAREDLAMPLGPHEEMVKIIPEAELVVIENSGHLMAFEQPRSSAEAIRRWLTAFGDI